ncbi:MAG: aquaporin [Geminicoccaceae bacterium]|nr:aquaporin [Geminicoccaceae bacterium]
MRKGLAELIGTFTLVFLGCGSAVIAGDFIGFAGISFAFGFALMGMAYGIGRISGCHINPAVSLGVLLSGRMGFGEFVVYVIFQCAGAIIAALVLLIIVHGGTPPVEGEVVSLGQNGFGPGYLGEYSQFSAFVFEAVATFLFVIVILGSTHGLAAPGFAGLGIGITLTAIHLVGINITGVSVNPARSLGPALFAGGEVMSQLWLFIAAPVVGAVLAAIVNRVLEGSND